ncbi:MAG: hypothetical protein D6767_09555, partial [Candidatus Hydrogenedentota bacterium]
VPDMPTQEAGLRVVNKFPYLSVLYKWDVPHGTSNMRFVCLSATGASCTNTLDSPHGFQEIWSLTSLYRIVEGPGSKDVKSASSEDWQYYPERAINYWSQYYKNYTLQATSFASVWSAQKYYSGAVSGCLGGNTNTIYHVKANHGTPHVQSSSACGGSGATVNPHPNGGNFVDIFTPMPFDSSEEVWESFASFTYAYPYGSEGRLPGSLLSGSQEVYYFGYTGTVMRFAVLWWKPRSFVEPTKLGLGIDFNRDGKYSRSSNLQESEIIYYRYAGSTEDPANGYPGNVSYGSTTGSGSYYCEWGKMPYQKSENSSLMPCKPYVLYQNIRIGENDVSYPEGSVIPYHFAFLVQDQDPTAPISRHPATMDPDSEIYMGTDISKNNSPVMQSCGYNQSPPCSVTPFDPWFLIKYRKPPTLEAYPVVKNGDNYYQFKVKYSNPYKIPPSCSEISTDTSGCSVGNVGHSHILIDLNGNGIYEDSERFKMSVQDPTQDKSDFDSSGVVVFYFPNPNTNPQGYQIKFGNKVQLKYAFDFAEYKYDGTGNDRGLKADEITGTFNLDKLTEPLVVRNNYQHPGEKTGEPVKIIVGNRTADGKIIKGKYSVRIYSASGRMVYDGNGQWVDRPLETADQDMPLIWNLKSNAGKKVGSGVYLVIMVREIEGEYLDPVTKKIVVVRGKEPFRWE